MAPRILAWHRDSGRYEKVFSRKDAESAEDAEGERGQGQYLAENAEDAEEGKHRGSISQRTRRTQRRGIENSLCVLGDLCEIFVFRRLYFGLVSTSR